jgi:uncharacterized membrane protein YgaE (UPF0421/DUF939 family)
VGKFKNGERTLVKSIVATLSIKKESDSDIIKAIYDKTNKTITTRALYDLRQSIKKESYDWYKTMREGQYEYIHEFKERIDEILWLQKKHHNIIDSTDNPSVQQTSLAELHRLNITLSNYFDVAPDIINGSTLSETPKAKTITTEPAAEIIV